MRLPRETLTCLFKKGRQPSNMSSEVTQLLNAAEQGDSKAADELLPLVYEELRRLASAKMAKESPGQTLQPTGLVHEAWLKLVGNDQSSWQNRSHFFSVAAESMRRILIDRARRKARQRHGGEYQRVDMEHVTVAVDDNGSPVLSDGETIGLTVLDLNRPPIPVVFLSSTSAGNDSLSSPKI